MARRRTSIVRREGLDPKAATTFDICLMITRALYGQNDEALAREMEKVTQMRRSTRFHFSRDWRPNNGRRPARRPTRRTA